MVARVRKPFRQYALASVGLPASRGGLRGFERTRHGDSLIMPGNSCSQRPAVAEQFVPCPIAPVS
jgi:hypothetical protein